MVKITKSNPYSKRNGVKNETMPYKIEIQPDIQHSLTAMRLRLGLFKFNHFMVLSLKMK